MMSDNFTEVTSEGWFSRIGSSIKGILFGLLLFAVSFVVLFWNEGRTVERTQTLNEGSGAVISVDASMVSSMNQDKLVHFSAFLTTDEVLEDKTFQVKATALKLYRDVEMYQWVEDSETHSETAVGGEKTTTTTYSYSKKWRGSLESSNSFKKPEGHQNPQEMPLSDSHLTTSVAMAGAYNVPESMVNDLRHMKQFTLDTSVVLPTYSNQKIAYYDGGYYLGTNSATPTVGDMKVSYRIMKPLDVSIIAQQRDNSLTTYNTKAGGTINMIVTGTKSSQSMFKQAHEDNIMMMWILRAVGVIMMTIGLSLIFSPLAVIADVVPFIGSIVSGGTVLFAILISLVLSLVTISIAWIFYRPLIGLALLAVAGGVLWLIKVKFKKPEVVEGI